MNKQFEILHEDDSLLVINKKEGLVVHKGIGNETGTLVDLLIEKYPELKEVGKDGEFIRAGIVHRLDKETSGVMLIAKTQEMFLYLTRLFADRKVRKEYIAFVYGVVKKDRGSIVRAIKRSSGDFRKRAVVHGNEEGKDAHTEFVVKKRGENATMLSLFPLTGRTHQLRVHLRSIGNPIIGDRIYTTDKKNELGLDRLALHSYRIIFSLPEVMGKKELEFIAPLPESFKNAEKLL